MTITMDSRAVITYDNRVVHYDCSEDDLIFMYKLQSANSFFLHTTEIFLISIIIIFYVIIDP